MVHIYFGEGKGKTTAAMGLCIRCAGHNKNVCVVQFLKDGSSGEICVLKDIKNVNVKCFQNDTKGFCFNMKDDEKEKLKCETAQGFLYAENVLKNGVDMLILDEIGGALENEFVSENEVLELIEKYKDKTEIVMTGRYFPKNIIDRADYVSKICEVKHPFKKGAPNRCGIEY